MPSSTKQLSAAQSPWRPLWVGIFRNLLIADFVSDIGTFIQSTGAAWLMVSLTTGPMYVALIQTASTLPFFLLALPAGSIGDIFDRRKLVLTTELWMLGFSSILAVVAIEGMISPWSLLTLTLAISLGNALESPTWRAILPELVQKEDLTPAIALNGIEFNLARAVGPGLAGFIIAAAGVGTAFVLNALSFFGVIVVVLRWKRPKRKSIVPVETVASATVAAIRYVRYSPNLRTMLLRSGCVMFFASAFWALLPTVAYGLSGSPVGYGLLLAFFGIGAILGAALLQQAKSALHTETVLSFGTILFSGAVWATGTVHALGLLCVALLFGGAAWIVFMSIFNTLAQTLAPEWSRARVQAVYLLVSQGSLAAGSAVWGLIAERTGAPTALMVAAAGVAASLLLALFLKLPDTEVDLNVWNHWPEPAISSGVDLEDGPVLVTIEYTVAPQQERDFLDAIHSLERIRRRDGATRWGIFRNAEVPDRYLETFVVHSWAEHLRQHARFTVADRDLEVRVRSYTVGHPKVSHLIYAKKRERILLKIPTR